MKYLHYKLCLVFAVFSIASMAQETGKITGQVFSGVGNMLPNANIVLSGTEMGTSTDSNGQFLFEAVPAGKYRVEATSVGYQFYSEQVTVKAGSNSKLEFSLAPSFVQLSQVAVKGGGFDQDNSTATVDVLDSRQIQLLNIEQPARLVEQVAGVDLGAYRQGGVADVFSIRGFGGGGHEGQAGIQIDGVSLNEAEGHEDGYADMNIIIPINISQMSVYKGPSSVLYGRFAQGGTVAFETKKGGTYQNVRFTGGSFNTYDAQVAIGQPLNVGNNKLETNLALQLFNTDGYSTNSDYLKGNVTGRLAYNISDKTDIALSLRGHSSEWDAPGYISQREFYDDNLRDKQAPNAQNDGGSKLFSSQRFDLNHTFNDDLRLLLYGYRVEQNFTRFAKFGFEPGGQTERFNTRDVYSYGGSLNGRATLGAVGLDWIAGAEYYDETTFRKRWTSEERVRLDQIQQRTFDIQTISAFAEGEFKLSQYFRPSIGLRFDTYTGRFTNEDPGQDGFTADLNDLSNFSPKLGVRSTLFEGFDLRANVSQGFSLPNSTSKYDPDLNLNPVQIWQYEAGIHYRYQAWLDLSAVAFVLNTSKEIVENPPGSGDLVNAGRTQRRGVETKATLKPFPGLNINGTFAYITTEILSNPSEDLVGKELTAIPSTTTNIQAMYTFESGLGGLLRFRDVGSYYISSQNDASYDGYTVAHFMAFYNFDGRAARKGRVFFEVNNLTNEKYAESVFGSAEAMSFAPAPITNFTFGITYNL